MPQYLVSVWHDDTYETDFSTPTRSAVSPRWERSTRNSSRRRRVFAAGLHPRLRPRSCGPPEAMFDDRRALRRNQRTMGGFWVIDASDLDAALEWAGAAEACGEPVEVRPAQG